MFPIIKTLQSFFKAKLLLIILLSVIWAIVVVASAVGIITFTTANLIDIKIGWLDKIVNILIGLLTSVGGWFILPAIIPFIAGIFQEKVIYRVEVVYYPHKVRKMEPRFWPDFIHDLRFLAWALFLNILILPLQLLGIGFILSIILNTYLLGREFFESSAGYHLGKPAAKTLGSKNKLDVYVGGLVLTLLSLIPILNIFIPIFAIVWMVHVYHAIQTKNADN